jgi:hypothetical protein
MSLILMGTKVNTYNNHDNDTPNKIPTHNRIGTRQHTKQHS